jgi:ABC-type molybdate transport system substrate-binding protein
MRARRTAIAMALLAGIGSAWAQGDALTVYAAGSLKGALAAIAQDYEAVPDGAKVRLVFGASGLLRDRLQGGEKADVFASANMAHPQSLAAAGKAQPALRFTRNRLCALASPAFSLQGRTLVDRLLDPAVRVGTSTPKADPAGDYAFALFDRIEATGSAPAGSAAALKAKALQLTGGPTSAPPPADRSAYGVLMAAGQADVFLTYCTGAQAARSEVPGLQVLEIPEAINVAADYGLAVLEPASPAALRFAAYLLSPPAQQRLRALGFAAP